MNKYGSFKWRCRRGMRELDLLLGRFLELRYDSLTDSDRELFAQFLDEPNERIVDWLLDGAEADSRYRKLIEQIQSWNE
uniref:FAD assembly factor SdhE n=1 Tax=Candidatus Kentrum sp. TUN TaxID=2126343 RepID=A0A450ZS53_9GAMM|nr:MAG: antitoxin CptB [Candidatus Kentron sp. TUN]VFK51742.1 MAG: antitoxin CptB [Candidatus Kentron sp. TUN]VFK56606.1 MAG: antitoxin CptB [Candidatus Kentron sp. TUN]